MSNNLRTPTVETARGARNPSATQQPAHITQDDAHEAIQLAPKKKHSETRASAPLEPLPLPLAILVAKGATYSSDDLWRLINMIREQEANVAKYPQIFRLFLEFLKEKGPFTTNDHRRHRAEAFVKIALYGIYAVLRVLGPTWLSDDNTFVVQDFTRSWPDIWRWMKHLHSNIKLTDAPLGTGDQYNSIITLLILAKICESPKTSADRAIISTPGVSVVVADIWAHQCDRDSSDRTLAQDCLSASTLLLHLLHSDAVSMKDLFDAPAAELKRTSTALLKLMRMSMRLEPLWAAGFFFLVLIAECFSLMSQTLSKILLSQNSVLDVCHALDFYTSSTLSEPPAVCDLVVSCFRYLRFAISQTDGFTWIHQAVKAGLIPSLLRCVPWGVDEVDKQTFMMVGLLADHTIYRSLLRASLEATGDPSVRALEAQISRESVFWKNWVDFKHLFSKRVKIKARFDEDGKLSQTCYSEKCPKATATNTYRSCSSCQDVYYCSKACQQYDWKQGGHREYCKAMEQIRAEGRDFAMPARDMSFLLFLALAELTSYVTHLFTISGKPWMSEFTNNAEGLLGSILIDLTVSPTEFGIYIDPETALPPTDPAQPVELDTHTNKLDIKTPSTTAKIVIKFPYGSGSYCHPIFQDISVDMAGILFGRDAVKVNRIKNDPAASVGYHRLPLNANILHTF